VHRQLQTFTDSECSPASPPLPPVTGRRPTASGFPSASLGHHGVHSLLQKRHQVRSARVRRHTVFDKPRATSRVPRRYPCAAPSSDSRPMRLFSKPSFGDLRCKTLLHVSRCT
jgi:hypothetical protein